LQIELVYESTCPNVESTRAQLLRALSAAGIQPRWREWDLNSPEAPPHVRGYGSPTVLVDGSDVSGAKPDADDSCCRIYSHAAHANKGVPPIADIVRALKSAQKALPTKKHGARWQMNGALLPAVGVAFLPKLACPACWPAYAGLMSSLGIGFFDYTPYLLPLTAVFVLIAVFALLYRAEQRRGYKPFLTGLTAGAILLTGKFYYDSDIAMYTGLALLVLASLWNTWPRAQTGGVSCPACLAPEQESVSNH
jgi:hypothetical protein